MGDQLARTKAEMFTCHMKIKLKEGVSHGIGDSTDIKVEHATHIPDKY